MKTEALNKCLNIFRNWRELDDNQRQARVSLEQDGFAYNLIEPFRRELAENLIHQTSEEQKHLIIFYINEISRVSNFVQDIDPIEDKKAVGETDNLYVFQSFKLNSDCEDWFAFMILRLFMSIFNEIQIICNNNNISFLAICQESGIDLTFISPWPTLFHEQRKASLTSNGSTTPQTQSLDNHLTNSDIEKQLIEIKRSDKPEMPIITTPPESPDLDFKKELLEIKGSINQFWLGIPMTVVIDHFEIMTRKKSKNGKVYLTDEQFIRFLKKGFLDEISLEKQEINCSRGEKGLVIKKFWEFFDLAVSEYGHPTKSERFIKLITECFTNWSQTTIKPFFKPKKVKGEM